MNDVKIQGIEKSNLTHITQVKNSIDSKVTGKEGNLTSSDQFDKAQLSEVIGQEEDSPTSIDLTERYLSNNYDFRFNQVLGRMEFKKKANTEYILLTDFHFNSLNRELMKKKIKVSKETLRLIINSDFAIVYNPFTQYFDNLPTWNGDVDYIEQLADTVKTENDEKWKRWFKKWLVAVVACATEDKLINHTAIVFSGKQGIGKTTWMLRLVPVQLRRYFYSGIPNLNNKDTKIRMAECFLINLDEMDNLSTHNTDKLKEIITTPEIKIRRAYGHFDELMPRRASFMGSVNNKQFLNDATGNRRFLCFDVSEIQFNHNVNLDMVYAQAKSLLNQGFAYHFNEEEIKEVEESNEQYQAISYIEELILKWFEPVNVNVELPTHKWSATEIGQFLATKSNLALNNSTTQSIGRYMKKYNFDRVKHLGAYVYALKEKTAVVRIVAS